MPAEFRPLNVEGAFVFTPKVFPDDRGLFVSPLQEPAFREALGHRPFRVAQSNHSLSKRGVVRGVHYTLTPPGVAKYVYCPRGRAIDIVVDLRIGSPTFGRWDAVELNSETFQSMYFPVGAGHAFIALEDDTVMSYMISGTYVPEYELAISPLDPQLGLPIPEDITPLMSPRDEAALTLEQARDQSLLPDYATCLEIEAGLHD
ncbi:dTDP-4-dehydrorhamnose 3,5-epimerase [Streptomyces sodiiphilus]|uniref:dTDP-4-dehydrorhamnose 3,5-epimerase n=1 Tax=Streptomyces sodiiphilus TaxID=226217 RepID=A0ABP5AD52_9ACTN